MRVWSTNMHAAAWVWICVNASQSRCKTRCKTELSSGTLLEEIIWERLNRTIFLLNSKIKTTEVYCFLGHLAHQLMKSSWWIRMGARASALKINERCTSSQQMIQIPHLNTYPSPEHPVKLINSWKDKEQKNIQSVVWIWNVYISHARLYWE